MERAAIYERISDDREGRELGVDRQDKDCRALAKREGLTVVRVYRDNDMSASTKSRKRRPDYEQMLKDARAGKFGVIIAYTSSRLTRQPRENEDLIDLATKHGIRFAYVRSPEWDLNTAQGRGSARTRAARDAEEAEEAAERVARAVLDRAERGDFHGGPRGFGITEDGCGLVEEEAALIRGWYDHVIAGGSLAGIRTNLERRGVPSATGAPWRTPVIRKILLNPRNAGIRIHDGVEYKAPNPPIVPEQTWRAVHRALTDPDRRIHQLGPARKHIGTGLFICERCELTVNAAYDGRGSLIYKCLKCFRTWKADPLNRWIDDVVVAALSAEDARERLLPRQAQGIDVQALDTEAASIKQNLADLVEEFALAKGAIREALNAGLRKGEARLEEIKAELTEAGQVNALAAVLASDDPVAVWRATDDVTWRQAIIRALVDVRMGAPIRGRAVWDPVKFLGGSRWVGDIKTWAEHWHGEGFSWDRYGK